MIEKDLIERLENLAEAALQEAKLAGADHAKVSASANKSWRVSAENREFSLANSLVSSGIGIAVHCGQKRGTATVNSMSSDDVRRAVREAVSIANYSVADEHLTLATEQQCKGRVELPFLEDPSLVDYDQIYLQDLMAEVMHDCLADPKLALERFEMGVDFDHGLLANSLGVRQAESQSHVGWSFMGMARDKDEVSGMDYTGNFSYGAVDIASRMRSDAVGFSSKVVENLGAKKCSPYRGPVILSPRAVQSLLISTVMFHASGGQIMDDKSRWSELLGSKVASKLLTIIDHPHESDLSGATSYDGDGIPTKKNIIIESGTLAQHNHSLYTAKRTGKKTTAFSGGPFGLCVEGGDQSFANLLDIRKEILVIDRFSGNVDPLTGDFSGVAKSSRLFNGGQIAYPVLETMVSGNAFDILENIIALENKVHTVHGGYKAPSIAVDNVVVS
jgi:PmbA protein